MARLEKYSWREHEKAFNGLPQFRTAIPIAASPVPLRIHFIHVPSPHVNAVPLLLVPPFPFSNLSLGHLVKPLTEPDDAATTQPFHLVVPSLPGLGFSDPFPNGVPVVATAADMLNTLMARLSYPHYLATNAGGGTSSPAEMDWKLLDRLATRYPDSCLGAHLISPRLASPRPYRHPWEWAKWSVASFMQAGIFGYSDDDFPALDRALYSSPYSSAAVPRPKRPSSEAFGLNRLGLREPNTLAYALCDSPTGLLVSVLQGLRVLGPRVDFGPDELITLANLAWLPGPENAMRLWAACAMQPHDDAEGDAAEATGAGTKPRVAITAFLGGGGGPAATAIGTAVGAGEGSEAEFPQVLLPGRAHEAEAYHCPAWGNTRYSVVFSQRLRGRAGLLAWERPAIIAAGVRGLAREVLRADPRLRPETPATVPLEQVVIAVHEADEADADAPVRPVPEQNPSSSTEVEVPASGTGTAKGKAPEHIVVLPPPAAADLLTVPGQGKEVAGASSSDEATPDTLVTNTPPLDKTP